MPKHCNLATLGFNLAFQGRGYGVGLDQLGLCLRVYTCKLTFALVNMFLQKFIGFSQTINFDSPMMTLRLQQALSSH